MKKALISLPQVEWSCFLASYLQNIIHLWANGPVHFDIIEKNVMDNITFPHVCGKFNIVHVGNFDSKYDIVVNMDSDPLLKNYLDSKYENVVHISDIIYKIQEHSIWSLICGVFNVNSDLPNFKFNFPNKAKNNKSDSGVAIKDDRLRMYVKTAFFADNNRLWHIPVRLNLLKRYDECNTVRSIVTDDIFCALSGYSMGKDVIFLKTHNVLPNISILNKLHIQDVSGFINAVNTEKTS